MFDYKSGRTDVEMNFRKCRHILPHLHPLLCAAPLLLQLVRRTKAKLAREKVPVDRSILGSLAEASCPTKEMVFVAGREGDSPETLESTLYLFRRAMRGAADEYSWGKEYYVASCSSRTIVYKGMVQAGVLARYYLDLQNPLFKTLFVVFHRRFSTNTMPKWPLAQPMRSVH